MKTLIFCPCTCVANDGLQRPLLCTDIDDSTKHKVDLVYSIAWEDEGVCAWNGCVGCHVLSVFVFVRVLVLAPWSSLSRSLPGKGFHIVPACPGKGVYLSISICNWSNRSVPIFYCRRCFAVGDNSVVVVCCELLLRLIRVSHLSCVRV